MATPKRKHSKSRTRQKRNEKLQKTIKQVQTVDGKNVYKRPHVEEAVEV